MANRDQTNAPSTSTGTTPNIVVVAIGEPPRFEPPWQPLQRIIRVGPRGPGRGRGTYRPFPMRRNVQPVSPGPAVSNESEEPPNNVPTPSTSSVVSSGPDESEEPSNNATLPLPSPVEISDHRPRVLTMTTNTPPVNVNSNNDVEPCTSRCHVEYPFYMASCKQDHQRSVADELAFRLQLAELEMLCSESDDEAEPADRARQEQISRSVADEATFMLQMAELEMLCSDEASPVVSLENLHIPPNVEITVITDVEAEFVDQATDESTLTASSGDGQGSPRENSHTVAEVDSEATDEHHSPPESDNEAEPADKATQEQQEMSPPPYTSQKPDESLDSEEVVEVSSSEVSIDHEEIIQPSCSDTQDTSTVQEAIYLEAPENLRQIYFNTEVVNEMLRFNNPSYNPFDILDREETEQSDDQQQQQ